MTTRDDLLTKGYTNEEIDKAINDIIPASELAAGMPLREELMKSNYILAALSGGSGESLTSGGIQNLYTNNLLQYAYVQSNATIYYTKDGSVWEQPINDTTVNYDLTDWNTALVKIKSAGGSGVPADICSEYYYGESHGSIVISDPTKVIFIHSGHPSMGGYSQAKGNKGGEGIEYTFLVDVSSLTNITLTLGVGGLAVDIYGRSGSRDDNISSHDYYYRGNSGSSTYFGGLITIYGAIPGADYNNANTNATIPGTDGCGAAIQFMKIN